MPVLVKVTSMLLPWQTGLTEREIVAICPKTMIAPSTQNPVPSNILLIPIPLPWLPKAETRYSMIFPVNPFKICNQPVAINSSLV